MVSCFKFLLFSFCHVEGKQKVYGERKKEEKLVNTHLTIPVFDCKLEHTKVTAFISNSHSNFFLVERRAGTFAVLAIVGEAESRGAGAVVGAGRVLTCVLAQSPRVIPAFIDVCQHNKQTHSQLRGTSKAGAGGCFLKF